MGQLPVKDARFHHGSAVPVAESTRTRDEQVVLTIRLFRDSVGRFYVGHFPASGGPGSVHEVEADEAQRFFFDLDTWLSSPAEVFPELPESVISMQERQRSA